MEEEIRQKTLGLSFSGGGVHAWAEVAVYEVLEKQNVVVAAVTGTSMGSFLAAAVASGLSAEEINQIIRDTDVAINKSGLFNRHAIFNLFSLRHPMGLVLMEKLIEVIKPVNKIYGEFMLSDVPKPLAIPAVDIISNKIIIFTNDPEYFQPVFENAVFYEKDLPLIDACLASSAYPVILSPVMIDDYQLIDGGVLLNSPAALFSKDKVEYVLSIVITPPENSEPVVKRVDVALRALDLMVRNQEEHSSNSVDQQYNLKLSLPRTFEFGDSDKIIKAGQDFVRGNPVNMTGMYERTEPQPATTPTPEIQIVKTEPASFSTQILEMWARIKDSFTS